MLLFRVLDDSSIKGHFYFCACGFQKGSFLISWKLSSSKKGGKSAVEARLWFGTHYLRKLGCHAVLLLPGWNVKLIPSFQAFYSQLHSFSSAFLLVVPKDVTFVLGRKRGWQMSNKGLSDQLKNIGWGLPSFSQLGPHSKMQGNVCTPSSTLHNNLGNLHGESCDISTNRPF